MRKINKISVFSLAKLQAVLGALFGLFLGIIYSFGGLTVDILVSSDLIFSAETPGLSYGTILAFGALIGMPVIFGVIGFVLGLIEAIFYNYFARKFGGLKVEFE